MLVMLALALTLSYLAVLPVLMLLPCVFLTLKCRRTTLQGLLQHRCVGHSGGHSIKQKVSHSFVVMVMGLRQRARIYTIRSATLRMV